LSPIGLLACGFGFPFTENGCSSRTDGAGAGLPCVEVVRLTEDIRSSCMRGTSLRHYDKKIIDRAATNTAWSLRLTDQGRRSARPWTDRPDPVRPLGPPPPLAHPPQTVEHAARAHGLSERYKEQDDQADPGNLAPPTTSTANCPTDGWRPKRRGTHKDQEIYGGFKRSACRQRYAAERCRGAHPGIPWRLRQVDGDDASRIRSEGAIADRRGEP
jgi:hypothetical protein